MPRRTWDLASITTLTELFDDGQTDAEIAKAMERSERSITNKRNDLGLKRYSRDTRLAAGESTLAERHRIATDALDECELQGKLSGCPEVVETVRVARRRMDRCEHLQGQKQSRESSSSQPLSVSPLSGLDS